MSTADIRRAWINAHPPPVTLTGVDNPATSPHGTYAYLLAWGRWTGRDGSLWAAGVSWVQTRRESPRARVTRTLLTMWVPADLIKHRFTREDYSSVPRVELRGTVRDWPALPGLWREVGNSVMPDRQVHVAGGPRRDGRY